MRAGLPLRTVLGVASAPALVAYAVAAVVMPPGLVTLSYADTSPVLAVVTVTVGLALAGAGLIALAVTPTLRIGGLAVAAGLLWFAPLWVGWYHGPGVVRAVAAVAAPFWLPTAVHLLLLCPDGRIASTVERWLVRLGYVGTASVAITLALIRNTFFDLNCWADCQVDLFVVHPLPRLASAVTTFGTWYGAGIATAAGLLVLRRRLAPRHRGGVWLTIAAGSALAAAATAYAVVRARMPLEDPNDVLYRAAYGTRCLAALLLASAALVSIGIAVSRRRELRRLAQAPDAAAVEAALRRATGDPELAVAYWLPTSRRYVDADGRPVDEPIETTGRTTTPLVRGDRLQAVVTHSTGVRGLERSLGGGVSLALENMLLRVEILAQLAHVRESRTRIVAAADDRRRTLERNLHDGAQQDLAALLYRLRMRARTAPEPQLVRATEIVEAALDELRTVAHGIYPAVLDHAGLSAALATLADTADVPVELEDDLPARRYPALIERTAYLVVAEGIAAAGHVSHISVSAREDGELLVITMPSLRSTQHIADRVGAAGGRTVDLNGLTRVELPCGS